MLGRLPFELYNYIFSSLTDAADLCAICLISRDLLPEARRRLYHSTKLTSVRLVPRFAHTVVRRPHIAMLVRELTVKFPMRFTGARNQGGVDLVHTMLQALPALRRLNVVQLEASLLSYLLSGCNLRLEALSTRAGAGRVAGWQELAGMLGANHPELTEWIFEPLLRPRPGMTFVFSGYMGNAFLPRLRVLSIPAVVLHVVPWQRWALTRLTLDLTAYGAGLDEAFARFGPTLVSLSLVRHRDPYNVFPVPIVMPMLGLIAQIATSLTALRFLSLTDVVTPNKTEIEELPKSSWTALKHLEMVVWWTEEEENKWNPFERDPPLLHESETVNLRSSMFATCLAEACPSVQRFIFVSYEDDEAFTWNSGVRERYLWRRVEEDRNYTSAMAWMWA